MRVLDGVWESLRSRLEKEDRSWRLENSLLDRSLVEEETGLIESVGPNGVEVTSRIFLNVGEGMGQFSLTNCYKVILIALVILSLLKLSKGCSDCYFRQSYVN
jgi:hypothetical protein